MRAPPAGKIGEWRFDKRSYGGIPPPRNLTEPPKGMKNDLVRQLISAINEATAVIPGVHVGGQLASGGASGAPCLLDPRRPCFQPPPHPTPPDWDNYAKTGKAVKLWDGVVP